MINDGFYNIFNNFYQNMFTDDTGSAIHCEETTIQVYMSQCSFINCTSTGTSSSSVRTQEVGGGACLFDICDMIVSKCIFNLCNSQSIGSAIYACGQQGRSINAFCISGNDCNQIFDSDAIFCFERSNIYLTYFNSTNCVHRNQGGLFHFGGYPYTFTCHYVYIAFKTNSEFGVPLGLTLFDDECISHLYYLSLINCSHENGFISVWKGKHIFRNTYFFNCLGKLLFNVNASQIKLFFIN